MKALDVASCHPIVYAWIVAFNHHDLARIVELYAEDAELIDAGMKHSRRGRGEIERWFSKRFRTMPALEYTMTRQLLSEGQAAVQWTVRGRTPRFLGQRWLARPFEVDGVSIFTIKDGLIEKQRGYYDHLAVVEQALPLLKWLLPVRL